MALSVDHLTPSNTGRPQHRLHLPIWDFACDSSVAYTNELIPSAPKPGIAGMAGMAGMVATGHPNAGEAVGVFLSKTPLRPSISRFALNQSPVRNLEMSNVSFVTRSPIDDLSRPGGIRVRGAIETKVVPWLSVVGPTMRRENRRE